MPVVGEESNGTPFILWGWVPARRSWILEMTEASFRVRRTDIFGTREWEWPRTRVRGFAVADTGHRIGPRHRTKTVLVLVADVEELEPVRLVARRPRAELQWAADELSRALR